MRAFLFLTVRSIRSGLRFTGTLRRQTVTTVGAAGAQNVTRIAVRVGVVDMFYYDFTMCELILT